MDYNNLIESSIEQIESNLFDKLSVDEIASQTFFSKFHYQRLFHSIVGDSIMEYVKKRRLTLAGEELCRTSTPVLEIALKYGYNSHESFTRAFRAFHGVTPTDCRKYAIFRSFSKITIKREMLTMTSNVMMSKNTNKIIALLSDFVAQADKLGNSTTTTAVANELSVFKIIADQTLILSSQIKREIAYITNLCSDNSESFTPINSLFQVIKAIEDVAFRSNILALNAELQVARTAPPKAEAVASISGSYLELARTGSTIASEVVTLFGELSALIQEDIKSQANIEVQKITDTLEQIAKKAVSVKTFLHDESEKSGGPGRSFVVIARELGYIADSILELANSSTIAINATKAELDSWANSAKRKLSSLEDLEFRMDILTFYSQLEMPRIPDQKGLNDATNQLVRLTDYLYASHQTCADSISELERLLPLLAEKQPVITVRTNEKMLKDFLFQGCILSFYLKTEFAKFGHREDVVSNEFSKDFEQTVNDIADSLDKIRSAIDTSNESASKKTLQSAFKKLCDYTSDIMKAGEQMGNKGGAVICLASELQLLCARIETMSF